MRGSIDGEAAVSRQDLHAVDAFHASRAVSRTPLASVGSLLVVLTVWTCQQTSVRLRVNCVPVLCTLNRHKERIRVYLLPPAVQTTWRTVKTSVSPWIVVLSCLTLIASVDISVNGPSTLGASDSDEACVQVVLATGAANGALDADLLVGVVVLISLAGRVANIVDAVNGVALSSLLN